MKNDNIDSLDAEAIALRYLNSGGRPVVIMTDMIKAGQACIAAFAKKGFAVPAECAVFDSPSSYLSGKVAGVMRKTGEILPSDWKLYMCDQEHGMDALISWGSEDAARKELAYQASSGRDVWLIAPDGTKVLPERQTVSYSFDELLTLWEAGANVPVNEAEEIEEPWAGFPKGTPREEVWHWFEEQSVDFSVAEAQMGLYRRTPQPVKKD